MTRTFLDAGVLIEAARSTATASAIVLSILDDPNREFVSTSLLRLEVLPKAIHYKRVNESLFYEEFFAGVTTWVPIDEVLIKRAYQRASQLGLNAIDCLHLEAAISAGAVEFITTEKTTKPLFSETSLRVTSL